MKPLIPISAIEAEPAPSIDPELRKRDRLRLIQSELRPITGTPIKDEADRLRRMALWCELDALVRARDAARQIADDNHFRHEDGKRAADRRCDHHAMNRKGETHGK